MGQAFVALVRLCVCSVHLCELNWLSGRLVDHCRSHVWTGVLAQDAVIWDRASSCMTSYLVRRCLFTFVSSVIDACNRTVGNVPVVNCISWGDMSAQGR